MSIVKLLKCVVRFPLDLIFFTFDFVRLLAHLGVKKFHPNRGCAFCFDSSDTSSFPRPVRAAAKYANLWLFKLICPHVRPPKPDAADKGICCYYRSSKLKPYLFRYGLAGTALVLLWSGTAWVVLVESRLLELLRPVADPTSLVLDESGIAKPSLFTRALFSRRDPAKAQEFVVRARQVFAAGDYESAKLAFLNAKKFDPDNAEIRLGLGNCYYRLNKRSAALMEFEQAARMDPEAEDVQEKLVELHAARGDFNKAIEHGKMAVKQKPHNAEVRLLLARSYLVREKPEASKQELEAALIENGEKPDVLYNVARVFQHLQEADRAEALYRKALQLDAKHLDSLIGLAGLLKAQDKKAEVRSLLEQSRELAPGDIRVAVHFAEMAYSRGEIFNAIGYYRQIVDRFPGVLEVQARLAELLIRSGEFDEGVQIADSLMAQSDPSALSTGNYIMANYYFEARLYTKALASARRVVGYSPQHIGARMLIVKSLLQQREFDRCAVALKEVLKIDPNQIEAQTVLARLLIQLGNEQEGIAALQETVRKHADIAMPLIMLGNLYFSREQYAEARAHFEQALEREPENAAAQNSVAMTLLQQGADLDRARDMAARLATRYPGHPIYSSTYGWALYQQGDLDEALRLMAFSSRLLPRNPEIRYQLGMIYFKKKNYDLSRKYLELALSMASEFAGIEEARQTLEALPKADEAAL